jgi:hypothetical protein
MLRSAGARRLRKTLRRCVIELELIQTQMAQKPMLRAEVGIAVVEIDVIYILYAD